MESVPPPVRFRLGQAVLVVKNHLPKQETPETRDQAWGRAALLAKRMATHRSIHAWRVPRTGEPGGLQSRRESQT